jgi:hypothetical protein
MPSRFESRHRLAADALVLANSVLGGLHHEYSLAMAPPESAWARMGSHGRFARAMRRRARV